MNKTKMLAVTRLVAVLPVVGNKSLMFIENVCSTWFGTYGGNLQYVQHVYV
jgi:hypothetical protein